MGDSIKFKCENSYCEIPGGTFQIGTNKGNSDEPPFKEVNMTGFRLSETEVSVGQYQAYLEANIKLAVMEGCGKQGKSQTITINEGESIDQLRVRATQVVVEEKCNSMEIIKETPEVYSLMKDDNTYGENYPFVGLSYEKKREFCQVQGGDLPTTAQLLFASRYDVEDSKNGEILKKSAGGPPYTYTVKSGYKNRFGVYNLLGNVWETSLDARDRGFYGRMPLKDPSNPVTDPKNQAAELVGGAVDVYWGPTERWAVPVFFDDTPGAPMVIGITDGFRCALPLPTQE